MTHKRNFQVGYPYHIYNRGNKKEKVYLSEKDYIYFIEKLTLYSQEEYLKVIAYCLMPNHYHILALPTSDLSISKTMQRLGTAYHYYYRKEHTIEGHIFQSRYKSKVVSDLPYLNTVISYIKENPVQAGLAKKFNHYRYGYIDEEFINLIPHMYQTMLYPKDNS